MRSGLHLKAARVLAGMTQRQLAQAASLHVNSVKYHEQQRCRIGGHAVSRMQEALAVAGVTIGEENLGHRSVGVLRG
jgi:hypothetical protein